MTLRVLPVLLALLAWSTAAAQLSLVVDGRSVGEVRTDVVSGHSYAPVDALASGLGATLAAPAGSSTLALTLGGHVIEVEVVEDAAAAQRSAAVRADGRPAGDLAAVRGDDAVWVPVTVIARAFGARVSFLPERNAVVVVSPRPTLVETTLRREAGEEVLTLRLDAPIAWSRFENEALGLSELHLRRARLERARTLEGRTVRRVDLIPEGDGVRVRIDAPGATLRVVSLADGGGSELRVRAAADAASGSVGRHESAERLVVIDPGRASTGTADAAGDASEGSTLALAEALAAGLQREGVHADLTRGAGAGAGIVERSAEGARADLFVSLRAADLPPGEVRIWVLGDAEDAGTLDAAVRRNAATELAAGVDDAVRRRILLGLVPDLEVGRRYGRSIATTLFQLGGYRAGGVGEAPLAVLDGAAGRGVLLEFAPADLRDARLVEVLTAAVRSALGGGR